jgi:Tfp pilus assembly protein PilV
VRKGSLLVEALVALIIIMFSVGIAMVSSYNLLRKSYENQALVELSDILLNECEKMLTMNVSQIIEKTEKITYHGKQFTLQVRKSTTNYSSKFSMSPDGEPVTLNLSGLSNINVVVVRVTDSKGRYVETKVVPKQ